MAADDNLQLIEHLFECFRRRDLDAVIAAHAEDVVLRVGGKADLPFAGQFEGREGVVQYIGTLGKLTETERFELRNFVAQGDTVVVEGFTRARVRETDRHYEIEWAMVFVFENQKIVRFAHYYDTDEVLKAFGRA